MRDFQRRAMASSGSTGDDLGKLLLRLSLGVLILLHGIAKVTGGVEGIVGMVDKAGVPGAFGYLVYVGEVLAPLLLIVGLWTRLAALVVAMNMVVAVALVHADELVTLGKQGGWALELQGMFLFGALAIALLGAGRLSIGGARGRFN
jgi:putative oxidoreductase